MAGPSDAYIAQLMAGLPPPTAAQAAAVNPPPPVIELDDPLSRTLAAANQRPVMPAPGPTIELDAPPPATPAGPPPPPAASAAPQPAATPVSVPADPAAPPPAAAGAEPPGLDPTQVEFRPVGGGYSPAGEAHIRGPQQEGHMLAAFGPPAEAAQSNELRTALQAQHEADMYERQAEAAQARQDAAARVQLRRQAEMQSAMQDYQEQVQRLGEMHLDQNRWWGNQSTGEKIGNLAAMFAGGFFGGANGAAQRIYKQIDQDIEAQKFDYNAGLDQAKARQTAFGMMMERYGSEDAATAAARAAALDYATAKVQQEAAQWKGTGAQNQTATLLGDLAGARENTIAAGFRFIPATQSAPRYQMAFRGHVAPGTFSEQQAQQNFIEHQTKPAQKADETILGGEVGAGVAAVTARAKAEAEAKSKATEHAVVMPNGDTVYAPSEAEATKVRDLATSQKEVQRLVREAKQIRSSDTWRASPTDRAKLDQIQKGMITQFAVQQNLGAISKEDMGLAVGGTADLFQIGPGVEARLDRMVSTAEAKAAARISTYAGAPARSAGKMPGSFKQAGGK